MTTLTESLAINQQNYASIGAMNVKNGMPQTNDQVFNNQYYQTNQYVQALQKGGSLGGYNTSQLQQMYSKVQGDQNALAEFATLVDAQASSSHNPYYQQQAQKFSSALQSQIAASNPNAVYIPDHINAAQVSSQVASQLNSILGASGQDPLTKSLGNIPDQSRQLVLQGMVNHYSGIATAPIR